MEVFMMRTIQTIPLTVASEMDITPPPQHLIPIHRIVAHEIRNYLTVLTEGIARLRTLPSIEAHRSLDRLKSATQHINDLIPVLQMEPSVMNEEPVNLTCLVWEQLALLEPLFHSRSVTLIADIPDTAIFVSGNSHQLGRALLNLIRNALEACHDSDSVTVTCTSTYQCVSIIIRDTGMGMTPEHLHLLWNPLFTTKPDGTGLGTSIARHIIINHGGSASANSTDGIGTTITIELPLFNPLSL
jgi:signal transduction histidine kinase